MAGIFNDAVLTRQGIELLAKAQGAGGTITLTKAVSGAGTPSGDLADCTALKDQRQEFPLETVTVQNKTNVFVKFIITNHPRSGVDLQQGYYVKEIGIYAKGKDNKEVLYAVATAVSGQEDYMPSYNQLLPSTITIEFLTEVANAETVQITTPNKQYVYDDATGAKYEIGVENGIMYIEEVEV